MSEPIYNPWRESLENCISGDNYLRANEYRELIAELDELYRLRAAPTAPAQGVAKLAAFGAWAAREFRDSLADVDGGSAQDAMERLGVIVKRVVTEPCGDACVCAEYGPFPHDCYTFPADVAAVMAAPTQEGTPK